jgi:hypothetical protein
VRVIIFVVRVHFFKRFEVQEDLSVYRSISIALAGPSRPDANINPFCMARAECCRRSQTFAAPYFIDPNEKERTNRTNRKDGMRRNIFQWYRLGHFRPYTFELSQAQRASVCPVSDHHTRLIS